ncbi:MAG TPA: hypothetical protein OIL86_15465 [Eggerthellaceae bacterium]|nr:hypothetical protein [Eggerthellaceae bacterium]
MEERDYQFVEHENPYTYRDGDLTVTRGSAWSGPGCHLDAACCSTRTTRATS